MLAGAATAVVVGLVALGAVLARRSRTAALRSLQGLVGEPIEICVGGVGRGPMPLWCMTGSLVAVNRAHLRLRPEQLPVPSGFSKLVQADGTVLVPVHEIVEIMNAGAEVRFR